MSARLLSTTDVADVGDTLHCWLVVRDLDGYTAAADTITVTATPTSGTPVSGTATAQDMVGLYQITVTPAAPGQWAVVVTVASATFGDDVLTYTVQVRATIGTPVDLADVIEYLGETSHTPSEVSDALESERAAQTRACSIPTEIPEDLKQALKRRVARNLAARAVPVATFTSFEGGGTTARVPKLDAEVARLEGPYRRWVIA